MLPPTQHDQGHCLATFCFPVHIDPTSPIFQGAAETINNSGELSALLYALRWAIAYLPSPAYISLRYDSKWAAAATLRTQVTQHNSLLAETATAALQAARLQFYVDLSHVKAHAQNFWNDYADEMANLGSRGHVRDPTWAQLGYQFTPFPTLADPAHPLTAAELRHFNPDFKHPLSHTSALRTVFINSLDPTTPYSIDLLPSPPPLPASSSLPPPGDHDFDYPPDDEDFLPPPAEEDPFDADMEAAELMHSTF